MSDEKEESTKGMAPSGAAAVKDPETRVRELRKETKDDRKKMALTMKEEGYNRVEISHAFKEVTDTGLGPKQWEEWEQEDKFKKEVGAVAGVVLTKEEKAWETTVLARFKTLTERLQTHVMDFGLYVLETVAPQVPANTPEEKVKNTLEWLRKAVTAFDPDSMRELEKFGAAAFLAAHELKAQIETLLNWAGPSQRLQNLAERCLYSQNPVNEKAFNLLMLELVKSINAVPRLDHGAKVGELPAIINAYATARGVTPEAAEEVMGEVLQEVNVGEQ